MYDKIVVPLDGSDMAARALTPAAVLAAEHDATVVIASVVAPSFVASMTENARIQASAAGIQYPVINLIVSARAPAAQLISALDAEPDALLCMATTGRSHVGQAIGSVAEEVLRARSGPSLLVGPRCEITRFKSSGLVVLPSDGSDVANEVIPLAARWIKAHDLDPVVVSVAAANDSRPPDPDPTADLLEAEAGRSVARRTLPGDNPPAAIVDYVDDSDAALVIVSTHGRTGLPRFVLGSIAMEIVHDATCPVLLHRPLRLRA